MIYVDVVALQISGFAAGVSGPQKYDDATRITFIGMGMLSSLRPLGIPLSLLGIVVLLRRVHRPQRGLVVAWLLSAGLFLVVDIVLGMQVRYAYFVMPLLCAGVGIALDALMARRRWGRIAGWGLVGFAAFNGIMLLFDGTFAGIKPTLTALSHTY
jgi:hypothetical protein